AAGNTATATLNVTYTAPDTTAPTVSITAPTVGATYSTNTSPLTLGGTASDNVGVTQVAWTSNQGTSGNATTTNAWATWSAAGTALGAEVTGAGPSYSLSWNTAGASNGAHSLAARARDAAGNTTTSSAVAVSVSNATVPIAFVQGAYAVPQTPQSTVSVTFGAAQGAGNLNVIAIGWSDTTAT